MMTGLLAGRVAAVTGAASGMGRVMARSLARVGARIAAIDVNAAGIDKLAVEPIFGGECLKLVADVSRATDCQAAVEQTLAALGALDILINCAGVSMATATPGRQDRVSFYQADPDGWQRILAVNTIGAFFMARFAVRPMLAQSWGRIVNVTTSFDTMLASGLSAYGASKAALEATSVSWAKELDASGVTVNILVPGGPTDTGFFPPGAPRPPVLLDPEIMGAPVAWLASPQSDGITGCRFIARDWDADLPVAEAAAKCRAPVAWPALAEAAQSARKFAI